MVDYIRAAYTVDVRFFRDSPATSRKIQWSFVAENTPGMPWAHAFGSRTWDLEEEEEPLVGELDGPRAWRGGTPPFPLPIVGPLGIDNMGICGTEEQWQRGASINDPIPANYLNTAVPRCCKRPPLYARGGVAVGSSPPVLAPCCGDFPLPVALACTFSNTSPVCSILDGIPFQLIQTSEQPPGFIVGVSFFRSGQFTSGGLTWRFWLICAPTDAWYIAAIDELGGFHGDVTFPAGTCAPFALSGSFDWTGVFQPACGLATGDCAVAG